MTDDGTDTTGAAGSGTDPAAAGRKVDSAAAGREVDSVAAGREVDPGGAEHVPGRPDDGVVCALTAGGVSILVETTGDRLPAVTYWGPELPGLDAELAAALIGTAVPVTGSNDVEPRPRLALVPEHSTGWSGRPGLTGAFANPFAGSSAGEGWSPKFTVTSVTLNGAPLTRSGAPQTQDGPRSPQTQDGPRSQQTQDGPRSPQTQDGPRSPQTQDGPGGPQTEGWFTAAGAGVLETLATDDTERLQLRIVLELRETGLVRTRASLKNLAPRPYALSGLAVALPVPPEAGELLDFGGRHNQERVPQRSPFGFGLHLRENRKGRTGADSAYLLHAGTAGFGFAAGDIWAVHTAWSGNHLHYAERAHTGEQLLGGGELLLPGEVFLQGGQAYESPWVYGAYGHGLDAIARRFHRHLRSRERKVSADRPVTINVWEAVYFDHDLDRLLDLAERAAAAGVERYVLDDGWFGSRRDDTSGLGDWTVSPDVWPNGLHPLIDRVRSLGMQFGLWFEPEMVNPDSDLARAHPEWIMAARAEWPVESRTQQVLNLAIPGAYEHVKAHMTAILKEYPIAYVKWDHNRDLTEAGDQTRGGRAAVHEQTLAFYRLLDELREAFPDLEIESCSSGGARVDLGVLERTDRVWTSDNIDPHDRQRILRWTTQLIPPEFMGSHIASGRSHVTGRRHDLSYRAGTAVFGHLGIEWDLAEATADELAELGEWIAFYKENRALLLAGDLVRMDGYDDRIVVHGVIATDSNRAIFAMAPTDSILPDPAARLRLRGLDASRRYRVRPVLPGRAPSGLLPPPWWGADRAGQILTGAALEHAGVAVPRLHPDQVVLYRADAV